MKKHQWQQDLHSGDEITIRIGKEPPISIIISEIQFLSNGKVKIITMDGQKINCSLDEIS